ncbi:MAG TPA: transporter [Opitutaceae bacterium]|nr:transporter [Opitutaceae bacterium]
MANIRRLKRAAFAPAVLAALALVPCVRAQITESPKTIGPGSVFVRMDAISFGIQPDTSAPNQYRALAVGTTIVSAGITDSLDFEFGTQLFLRDTFSAAGADQTHSGIGDISLRTKWTFWRDTSSNAAAAVVPYVMLPTHSSAVGNNSVQGGLILPWAADIGAGTRAAAMIEWDELRNVANTRYDTRWYGSALLQWDLGGKVGAYAEATVSASTAGSSAYSGTLGGGATLAVSKNFQWDYEISRVLGRGRNQWSQVLRFRWKVL